MNFPWKTVAVTEIKWQVNLNEPSQSISWKNLPKK